MSDRITACAEKLTSFGLVEGSEYTIDEIQGEIQSLVTQGEEIKEQYDNVRTTVNHHRDALIVLDPLAKFVKSLEKLAPYSRYIKGMYDQATRLDRIDDRRADVLDMADEMPVFRIKANEAEANIQELKNQNLLLHGEVKELKKELAVRPTIAVLTEIDKYSSGGRLTPSSTSRFA